MAGPKRSLGSVLAVLVVSTALPATLAQESNSEFEGWVEMLYRNVDVNGSERKYDEDFDGLSSGTRVRNLWANWSSIDSKAIDYARLDLRGLGGDPYERADLRLGAKDAYDLKASYTTQQYLYNLYGLIGDMDGHSWDTQRRITDIRLKLYPTRMIDVIAEFRQNQRVGETLWMKDINRELFRLPTPIDYDYRYYTLGATFRLGAVDVVFRQTRRDGATSFVNLSDGQTSLEPFVPGASTILTSYDWDQQEDGTSDLTTVAVNAVLGKRVSLTASLFGNLLGKERLDSQITQNADFVGFDFSTGTPDVPQSITNGFSSTDLEVETIVADVDLSITLAQPAVLHLQYRALDRDLEGTQNADLEGTGTTTTVNVTNQYQLQTISALFELRPLQSLTLRVGYRTLDRQLDRGGYQSAVRNTDFDSNDNETVLLGLDWRPIDWFRLDANYEDGKIEDPFASISLAESEQLRTRAVFTPFSGMNVSLAYDEFQNRNTAANFRPPSTLGAPSCDPTNPNQQPGICTWDSDFDSTRWSISVSQQTRVGIDYLVQYAEHDRTSNTAVNFDTALFGSTAFGQSVYDVDSTYVLGQINYRWSDHWNFFARYWISDSDGSNPLVPDIPAAFTNNSTAVLIQDYTDGELGLRYTFDSGIFVGGSYRIFDYDDYNNLLDYDGSIFTVSGGTSF